VAFVPYSSQFIGQLKSTSEAAQNVGPEVSHTNFCIVLARDEDILQLR
jgi:hypothetical protein